MTQFGNLSIRLSCIWHVKRTALAQVGRNDFGLSLGHSSIKDLWSREFFSFVFEDCFSRKVAKLATDSGIKSLLVFYYLPNAQSKPQKWLARGVLIGARVLTALNGDSIV